MATVDAGNAKDRCVWCRTELEGPQLNRSGRFCSDQCLEMWSKHGGGEIVTGDFDEHGEPL